MRIPSSLASFALVVFAGVACSPPEIINNGRPSREGEGDGDDEEGCAEDADCAGGEVCDGDVCVRVCDADGDCAGGEICRDARCVVPDCIDDADCPGGFFCDDNACVSIDGCDDGAARCVDADTAAVCVDGREVLDDCGRGFVCALGDCVDGGEGEGEEGEGEGEGEGEEGEGEGEGEGDVECSETTCLDDATALVCFFGVPVESPCDADEVCVDVDGCVPEACVPQCGARECGADPVCGTSCGSCGAQETCNASGRCVGEPPGGNRARIEVAVSDTTFDVYLSRAANGSFCDLEESCFFGNCDPGASLRPDWDSAGTEGDPSLTNGVASVLTPTTAQSYRVAAHRPRDAAAAATVTVNVAVDGVNVFGATKTLQPGQLWSGIVARWNGAAVTVSRTDVISEDFSCGGETCSEGGDECDTGFVCGFTLIGGTPSASGVCVDCIAPADCGAGDECRGNRCIDDTTDRDIGGVCELDVDCRDDLACGGGACGVPCDIIDCLFGGAVCCPAGGTCGLDGVCN